MGFFESHCVVNIAIIVRINIQVHRDLEYPFLARFLLLRFVAVFAKMGATSGQAA